MKVYIALFCLIVTSSVFAQGAAVPHAFANGNAIVASEFNANFQELANRNNSTSQQVTTHTNSIAALQTSVASLEGAIAQIQADLANLQSSAGGPPLLQYVGNSTGIILGIGSVRGMTELCQIDFPESRLCTTEEFSKTITFPAPIPDTEIAWIAPSGITGSGATDNNIRSSVIEPYAGASSINGPSGWNCGGWSQASRGLTVSGDGRFQDKSCTDRLSVSCCK